MSNADIYRDVIGPNLTAWTDRELEAELAELVSGDKWLGVVHMPSM
jgi:hypothetical protein